MTDLVKCCADSDPVLQQRDQMGPGDYFGLDHRHHETVEMHDAVRNDVRVACSKCHMATGWNVRDLPNMPGAGQDYVVKTWNAMATKKKQRADMLAHMEQTFGAEAVAEHFAD